MEADHVAPCKKVIALDELHPRGHPVPSRAAVRQHVHAEGSRQFPYGLPYPSEADDAHRQSVEFDQWIVPVAEIRTCRPTALTDRLGVVTGVQRELEEESQSHLRDRASAVSGNIRDGHLFGPCRRAV